MFHKSPSRPAMLPLLLFVLPLAAVMGPGPVFIAFMEGAAVLEAGPLDRLKLSRESLRPPMSCHVDPMGAAEAGLGKALEAGRDGGPWGWSMEAAGGCIMAAGGSEAMERPSSRSRDPGPVGAGAAAGAGEEKAPKPKLAAGAAGAAGMAAAGTAVLRPENRSSEAAAGAAAGAGTEEPELKSANKSC